MNAVHNSSALWLTWEHQPRNRSMARRLGVPVYELSYSGPRVQRYAKALTATIRLLLRERPKVVFASNPSIVLTCFLLLCRAVFRFRLASDAHYGGVVAVSESRLLQRVLDFANRNADLVIVTNPGHASRIRALGGRSAVCPDPLPELAADRTVPPALNGVEKSALFVCTFEVDEPYGAVFEAARLLSSSGMTVFVSGSYQRAGLYPDAIPQVKLLGFIDRKSYEAYLRHVDVVLDFTTWEDCLVCGAYEAMAAGQPCVLSRTKALAALFSHGTVFTTHEPSEIARATLNAYEARNSLRSEIPCWVSNHERAIDAHVASIRSELGLGDNQEAHGCVSVSSAT